MSDQDIVKKLLAKDERTLGLVYRTFVPKLRRFLTVKVRNPHDADEILQDILFAFLEALRDFHSGCKLETYLFSIAHHKVIDYYRRKKLRHIVFSQVPQLENLISPLLNPEESFDVTVLKEKLKRVFSRLIPKYSHILRLKYEEELSVVEIARKLGWTEKGTESVLFRARKAFAKSFSEI